MIAFSIRRDSIVRDEEAELDCEKQIEETVLLIHLENLDFNPFQVNFALIYSLKSSENLRFSIFSGGLEVSFPFLFQKFIKNQNNC